MNKGVIIAIIIIVLIIILGATYYLMTGTKTGETSSIPITPQMSAPRADWMCGPNYGNAQCPKGTWCSKYQICGTTPEHQAANEYSAYSNP